MKIKLKESICGGLEGRAGHVIDAPDDEAERLIGAGIAESYEDLPARIALLEAQLADAKKDEKEMAVGKPRAKKAAAEAEEK